GQEVGQAAALEVLGDVVGGGVFLDVQAGAGRCFVGGVDVDGGGVLGDVGVIGAVAGDAFAFAPGLELAQVLAQAVGDHGGAFGQRGLLQVVVAASVLRRGELLAHQQGAFDRAVE